MPTKTPKNKVCGREGGYVLPRLNGSESTSFHIDASPLDGNGGAPPEAIKKLGKKGADSSIVISRTHSSEPVQVSGYTTHSTHVDMGPHAL